MEGSILMDYHLVFIVISFILLILTIVFLFGEKNNKQELLIPMGFIMINIALCTINMLGFFSIDLMGIDLTTGDVTLTQTNDMMNYYMLFYVFLWLNTAFMMYAIMDYVRMKMKELGLPIS